MPAYTDPVMIQQDAAYHQALQQDMQRMRNEAEQARQSAARAENAVRQELEQRRLAEELERQRQSIRPPEPLHPIEKSTHHDHIFTVRMRMPPGIGGFTTHSYHRSEPLATLFQQARFDTRHVGPITLTILPRQRFREAADAGLRLDEAGFDKMTMVVVGLDEM